MKKSFLPWIILIALSLVWGSSFILMKRGLMAFSSDEVAALRITIASVFLSPLLFKYYKIDLLKTPQRLNFNGCFRKFNPGFFIYQSRNSN